MKKLLFFILFIGFIYPAFAQTAKPIDLELQKLKDKLAAAQHDTTRMMVCVDISMYFQDVQIQNDSALVYALKAEQIADKYPNYPKVAKVWNCLGRAYKNFYLKSADPLIKHTYFEQVEKSFKKCIQKAKQLGDEEYLKRAWFNNNVLYNDLPNKYPFFKNSLELINYIQKKAKWNGVDSFLLRKTYKRLCIGLDYEMGSKKFNEYLTNFKNLAPQEGQDYEELCLLILEQHAVLWKKADEQKFLEEYQIYKQTFKLSHNIDNLENYSALYYFTIQEYEKSFRIMTNYTPNNYEYMLNGNNKWLSNVGMKYMRMGQSAYMLNRNQEAIRYLNKAIQYINPIENTVGLENEKYTTLLYLGKAYKKAGNYKQALTCNEQADILYKQIHDIGAQALMAENDVQVEQIKQDKKVQEAQTQILLKEQETQLEKRQKYMFALFALVALLSTGWAFYNFRKTRRQNAIISQQATALQESNQVKDKIFALLGHDLRAPINRLVMRMNDSGSGQLPDIRHELKNMYDILNNVLYWASMQLKKITPVNRPTELKYLVSSVAEEYQFDLTEKNITFLNAIDKTTEVKTDENYLKIILRNLISNAIKFTNPNGFIKIDCSIKNSIAEIILKDTGIGVPPEKLKTIFNLPAPSIGTHQEKGTGLGLSLSLDIAKKLNGDIQIKSQEGRGTQVVLSLQT